jgi:hypothetical protein
MRPNSLKAIQTISDIGAAAETFLALNSHTASLTDLRISVSNDSMPHLSLLAGCTSLESLHIRDTQGAIILEETQNDVFLETVQWLRNCKNLERLSFAQVLSASALVTPVLLEHKIRLRNLEIDSYVLKDSRLFHQALAHQKDSLSFLSLNGETDGMFRDDVEVIVNSLKQLTQLKVLRLLLQELFHEEHLIAIITGLTLLEELYVNGLELSDRILLFVSILGNVRSATFAGISKFTVDGLLEFISHLGPGNRSIRVMIDMADPDTLLPEHQITLIRESLGVKVGGTLEYTPWIGQLSTYTHITEFELTSRHIDPNVPAFEGDSD